MAMTYPFVSAHSEEKMHDTNVYPYRFCYRFHSNKLVILNSITMLYNDDLLSHRLSCGIVLRAYVRPISLPLHLQYLTKAEHPISIRSITLESKLVIPDNFVYVI
jgi:hypothetical protein